MDKVTESGVSKDVFTHLVDFLEPGNIDAEASLSGVFRAFGHDGAVQAFEVFNVSTAGLKRLARELGDLAIRDIKDPYLNDIGLKEIWGSVKEGIDIPDAIRVFNNLIEIDGTYSVVGVLASLAKFLATPGGRKRYEFFETAWHATKNYFEPIGYISDLRQVIERFICTLEK